MTELPGSPQTPRPWSCPLPILTFWKSADRTVLQFLLAAVSNKRRLEGLYLGVLLVLVLVSVSVVGATVVGVSVFGVVVKF